MAACVCNSACPCHATPEARIAGLGVDGRALNYTARLLLAALCPPDSVFRGYQELWATVRPDQPWGIVGGQTHILNVAAHRLRRVLRPCGLTIETLIGSGYRLVRCVPDSVQPPRIKSRPPLNATISRKLPDTSARPRDAFGRFLPTNPLHLALDHPSQIPHCAADGCGVLLASHPRCSGCELLIGPGHAYQATNAAGQCFWCQSQGVTIGHLAQERDVLRERTLVALR
jgi:hypothetical protein